MNSKDFIKLCLDNGIEDVTITINSVYSSAITMHNDEVHKNQTMNVTTYTIKATYKNSTIAINSEYLDESLIDEIKEIAEFTENKVKDELLKPLNIKASREIKKEVVSDFEETLLNAYKISKKAKYSTFFLQELVYNAITKKIISSNGLSLESSNSYYEYASEITSKKGDEEAVTDVVSIVVKDKNELNIEDYTKELVVTNTMRVEKKNIKSGKYKILFKETVVSALIKYFVSMLDGNNVNKGITLLKDSLYKQEFSEKLTIIEEPEDEKSPSYCPFDDEGTKTFKKMLIENGVIKSYLYDNKSAKEKGVISTGNSYNGAIGVRNVYLEKGSSSFEDLVKEMDNGIIVNEVMVSQGATNINTGVYTGEIFSGFLVENGKIVSAIKDGIFTTNLKEIFNNVVAIGDKTIYTTPNISTPCLLVDNIMITGAEENED